MKVFLQTLCQVYIILFLCQNVTSQYRGDNGYSSGYADYPNPSNPSAGLYPDSLNAKLESHMDFLVKLYGSKKEVQTQLLDDVVTENYWSLDLVNYTIQQKLKEFDQLGSADGVEILELITDEMESFKNQEKEKEKEIYEQLIKSKDIFYCAIGPKETTESYKSLTGRLPDSKSCSIVTYPLWRKLVKANYENKNCNLGQTLAEWQIVTLAYRKFHGLSDNVTSEEYKIKTKLTLTLSLNYKYLHALLCPDVSESDHCEEIINILCEDAEYGKVSEITKTINQNIKTNPPTSASQILTLLEIQQQLGDISAKLLSNNPRSPSVVKSMLDSYLGIVDTVIGDSSVPAWKQEPRGMAGNQLHQLLLTNEAFVGTAADSILNSSKKADVNKNQLSVQMVRIPKNNEGNSKSGNVVFAFDDVLIWADDLDTTLPEHKVYAMHYKSWREMMNKINARPGDNGTDQIFARTFIGKGGIVSLGTRANSEKISVPVKYKIKFSEDENFTSVDNNGQTTNRRCLACEYLDEQTKTWKNSGCHVTQVDNDGVTCHCNHTTNFAAFMMPYQSSVNTTKQQELWLDIVEYTGSILSVIGLTLSFLIFCKVRNTVRNERIRAHMNLVVALLFVHLIQLGADYAVYNDTLCILTTLFTHYFLLASFMWMLVEGIFLYLYVVQVFVHSMFERLWWMYAIGWGFPAINLSIAAGYGLTTGTYIQQKKPQPAHCEPSQLLYPPLPEEPSYAICWLSSASGMTWSFIIPAILVILFNVVILCKVVQVLVKLSDRSNSIKSSQTSNPISYHSQNGSLHTSTYQPKIKSEQRSSIKRDNLSIGPDPTRDSLSQPEGLHGHVITRGSHSRTSSQCYQPMKVAERPRTVSAITINDSNFLKDVKAAVKGAAVLLPILGIPWICGMLGVESYALQVIFVVLNSLQGIAIFFVYCIFNGEVWRALKRQIQLYRIHHGHEERRRASSTGSIRAAFNKGMLRSWRRRSTAVTTLSTSQNV